MAALTARAIPPGDGQVLRVPACAVPAGIENPFRDLHLNVVLLRRTLFLSPRLNKQHVDQQRIGVLEMSDESFCVIAQLLLR